MLMPDALPRPDEIGPDVQPETGREIRALIWRMRKYHHGEIVLNGSFSHVSKPIFQVDIHVAAFSGPTMFAHVCTAPDSNVART